MTPTASDSDFHARIAALFIYPIKSCAGIALDEALLTETGLDLDRAWMVVDSAGVFVTQRELPRMALIQPTLRSADLVLRAPGMLALHLLIDTVESAAQVQVWNDTVQAYDMGDIAAQWFSDFLAPHRAAGAAPRPYRLVRFDPEQRRLASAKWTAGVEAPTQFADGFPLLVTSIASLEGLNRRLRGNGHGHVAMTRFRPNIVLDGLDEHDEDRAGELHIQTQGAAVVLKPVKPCARCAIPDIDPTSAHSDPAVGDTLQSYRVDARVEGGITFGMNTIAIEGIDQILRIGQPVWGRFNFD